MMEVILHAVSFKWATGSLISVTFLNVHFIWAYYGIYCEALFFCLARNNDFTLKISQNKNSALNRPWHLYSIHHNFVRFRHDSTSDGISKVWNEYLFSIPRIAFYSNNISIFEIRHSHLEILKKFTWEMSISMPF